MIKQFLAVIVGYSFFTLWAILFFSVTRIDPELKPRIGEIILTILFAGLGALLSGYIAAVIARFHIKRVSLVLSIFMALVATISMITQPEISNWTQLTSIFYLAPLAYLGGYLRLNSK